MHGLRTSVRFALLTGMLVGLTLAARAGETDRGEVALARIAHERKLTLRTDRATDRHALTGDDLEIVLVPGLPVVTVNGKRHALARAPRFHGGALVVPSDLVRFLPDASAAQGRTGALSTDVVVILDPGHGGPDPGALAARGVREKDINLAVALRVRKLLRARGVEVRMTRADDSFPSLRARAELANRVPNSIFVSLHANAAPDPSSHGVETFVLSDRISDGYRARRAASRYTVQTQTGAPGYHGERRILDRMCRDARRESVDLAHAIHNHVVSATGDVDRGVRQENFHVLRENYFAPAVLVEMGFLTHAATRRRLVTSAYQDGIARAVADGICAYLAAHEPADRTAWAGPAPLARAR